MRKNQNRVLFYTGFLFLSILLLSFSNEISKEHWQDQPDKTTNKIRIKANIDPIVLENTLVTNLKFLPLAGINVDVPTTTTWWVNSTMGKGPYEAYYLKFTIEVSNTDSTATLYGYWGLPLMGQVVGGIRQASPSPSLKNMNWQLITNDKKGYGWDELNKIAKVSGATYQYNSFRR